MCRIVKREKYKRTEIITWLKPRGLKQSPALVTNQIFVSALVSRRTKEKMKQKGERPEQPKPNFLPKSNPIKSYWSMMIAHIIYDLMGNDLQSQSTTYLWFGIKMKHWPMWDFIHLEQFFSIQLGPVFLLMFSYKRNTNVLNLIFGYKKFYPHAFIPSSHIYFSSKNICCFDRFGGLFLY